MHNALFTPSPKQPFSFLGQLAINSARHARQLASSGFQVRSRDRGGRWSWTLNFAQKRSLVGRWSWASCSSTAVQWTLA